MASLPNRDFQFSPEMSIDYTIVIIKQHTTTFQTLFSLNQAKQEDLEQNMFGCETLTQHNLQNTKPISKLKSLPSSATKDLSKTCSNLKNNGAREFTNLEEQ